MDRKLKTKWLKALRAGHYVQTEDQLLGDDFQSFCCLGVLADIQGAEWTETNSGNGAPIPLIDGRKANRADSGYLQPKCAGGIPTKTQEQLAAMNDNGKSFSVIADYIESNL